MKRFLLVALVGIVLWPGVTMAQTNPFTITADMSREQKLTILRAHIEYLQSKIIQLQAAAAPQWFVRVDYIKKEMVVSRTAGGTSFLTIPGTATTTVSRAIAAASSQSESMVRTQLTFEYVGGDEIVGYTAELLSPYRVNLIRTRADGQVLRETVSRAAIDDIVSVNFFGNTRIYEEVLGSYVKDIRRGRVAPEIVTIAASLFGVAVEDLEDTLTVDVKRYKRS